jgi:hypothetical protein
MNNMKKLLLSLCFMSAMTITKAQDKGKDNKEEAPRSKFKENVFVGGTLNLSLSSYQFTIGGAPTIGYAFNKWVDAGIVFNFNYTSFRDYNVYGDRMRQTVYGPGAFARLFPFPFLFAQVQAEHNFIKLKYLPVFGGAQKYSLDDNSILIGGGYTSGRRFSNTAFYYVSVMFDVSKNPHSPYVDGYGRSLPIVNAGIVFPLFKQGRRSYGNDDF